MISGPYSQQDAGQRDFQELYQIAAIKPFSKLAVKATAIVDMPSLVCQALAATDSGLGCAHGFSLGTTNSWPLLVLSGSCYQSDAVKGNFQELHQIDATKPFAKLAFKATTIAGMPCLMF